MKHIHIQKIAALAGTLTLVISIAACSTLISSDNSDKTGTDSTSVQSVMITQPAESQPDAVQSADQSAKPEAEQDADPDTESVTVLAAASLTGYGAAGANSDTELTLADMLTYAIEDEYLAHGEYEYIIDTFGSQRPFSNIIKAEETHISMLEPLFDQYGIALPPDQSADHLILPADIPEALQAGVQAEIDNIAMYDTFLSQDLPEDIRQIFTDLMEASEKHLEAFQRGTGR